METLKDMLEAFNKSPQGSQRRVQIRLSIQRKLLEECSNLPEGSLFENLVIDLAHEWMALGDLRGKEALIEEAVTRLQDYLDLSQPVS